MVNFIIQNLKILENIAFCYLFRSQTIFNFKPYKFIPFRFIEKVFKSPGAKEFTEFCDIESPLKHFYFPLTWFFSRSIGLSVCVGAIGL